MVGRGMGLDPFQTQVLREGGAFATNDEAFGSGSVAARYGMKGPKGSKTFLQSSLDLLRSKYKDPGMLANATANHLGIGMRQAMALLSVKIAVIVTAGQKLVKRVRDRASLAWTFSLLVSSQALRFPGCRIGENLARDQARAARPG